ncbi:MAG: GTPase, partial [Candidatus Gracilibacteria bacterium]|nr:GTPase [Candidatus Gracilibacteria bacterium]
MQFGKNKVHDYIVVANKADNESQIMEAWSLAGKGELEFFPVSVSHNKGIDEIRRFVSKNLTKKGLNYKLETFDDSVVSLALAGRPNVGKSSLINAIIGKDRVMVKDMPGTTRDAVDTKFRFGDKDFVLIDTAGIRRLSR